MPRSSSREAGGHLRTLFTLGVVGSLSDTQLVDRFVLQRDEMAFAALVERHGPMVFGVCRRVLRDRHEAEDAFQATFLILARKAATLARRERLANWLYGVAYRTAKDARGRACRRQSHEREVMVRAAGGGGPSDQAAHHEDLRAVLDEELARLPDRLRLAVVLCELEGHSRSEAARRLGIPEGTLSSRLARARDLLRERLTNRGLALSAGALALGPASGAEAGALPAVLIESTVQAAARVAAGHAVSGVASASVAALTEGVLKTMFLAKLKGIALGTLALGAVTAGAVLAQNPGSNSQPDAVTFVSVEEDGAKPSEGPSRKPNPHPAEDPARVSPSVVVGSDALDSVRPIPAPTERPISEVQPKQPQEQLILLAPAGKLVEQSAAPAADRMAALESKLDRILSALERQTRAAADPFTARIGLVDSGAYPMPPTNTDPAAVPAAQPVVARHRPATSQSRPETPSVSTARTLPPRYTATRPAASVTQRLDEIEKRLERLEKQLGGASPSDPFQSQIGSTR